MCFNHKGKDMKKKPDALKRERFKYFSELASTLEREGKYLQAGDA